MRQATLRRLGSQYVEHRSNAEMHDDGSEYQLKIVHEDQTEELSGWMNSREQVTRAIAALRESEGKAYWLQTRNVLCLPCHHRELTIVECRLVLSAAGNARLPRQTERSRFSYDWAAQRKSPV